VGAALAAALARLLTSTLFGVSPADPATFSMVTLLLLGTALAACGIPALRAAAADPASVLRTD
jgi:ABC-type lipoprotein release transport system permease subunit